METQCSSDSYTFYLKVLNSPKYVVAPMVAQSELPWRMLARKHGAHVCYTPMYNSKTLLMDKNYLNEVLNELKYEGDRPLIVQFCANTVENFVQASLLVEDFCDGVDLNLGCPQHIAQRGHFGAFLQDDWDLVHSMIHEARKHLSIGVSAKIRIFPEVKRTVAYAQMLQNAGCQLLAVHGRTRDQKRDKTGLADWSQIKVVKDNLKIPVFSNGNIQYYEDIEKCIEETGVDGVMVAEGHLTNPLIFEGVQSNVHEVMEEYLSLVDKYPTSISYVRTHAFNLLSSALEWHPEYREKLATSTTLKAIKDVCNQLKDVCGNATAEESIVEATCLPHWICQPYSKIHRRQKVEEQSHNNQDKVGLSKNQQKKRHKARLRMMKVASKRKAEHERKKERMREQLRVYEEDDSPRKDRITRTNERKQLIRDRLEAAMRDGSDAVTVCLDLSWSHAMNEKEISKLSNQLGRLYGSNRTLEKPAHLYFTDFYEDSALRKECVRKHDGFEEYKIDMTSQSYRDIFDSGEVIYLTPDATTALESVESSTVYVLGGLVDETVTKKLTLDRANASGISTRRLPVAEYMTRSGCHANYSTVFCVNQVFDILMTFHLTRDWKKALSAGVPPRKGYVITKEEQER